MIQQNLQIVNIALRICILVILCKREESIFCTDRITSVVNNYVCLDSEGDHKFVGVDWRWINYTAL